MNINENISALVQYGLDRKLIEPCDKAFIINQLLTPQQLDSFEPAEVRPMPLEQILKNLTDDAVNRGIISDDITSRDLYDTACSDSCLFHHKQSCGADQFFLEV